MKETFSASNLPAIVKEIQSEPSDIRPLSLSRHAVGYVLKGRKLVHYGDRILQVNQGDIFFLPTGLHYVEDIPAANRPFEQVVVYYSPEQFSRYLTMLSMKFGMVIDEHHHCTNCHERQAVAYPAWKSMKSFFALIDDHLRDGLLETDVIAESLKMLELVYLIVSNPDCCIQSKVLEHSDSLKESFEQTVHNNVFTNISIEELAQLTNRSLTSFKKEFKRLFFESPHQWMIKQRLMHARLLLISSAKPVAEIGSECNFPNTSHFIKLFKKEFGLTPSVYRHRYMDGNKYIEVLSNDETA